MDEQARYRWIDIHILPHEGEVRGWLRKQVRSLGRDDVDDLIQEAYARLWGVDFSTILNGRGYLFTVMRNLLVEHARRARIVPMERLGEIESLRIVSDEPEPERRIGARQELEQLEAAIAKLPQQCRRTFELQKFEGLSQREIAARMGISQKTVEAHLAKALSRILELMIATGGELGRESTATGNRRDERTREQD